MAWRVREFRRARRHLPPRIAEGNMVAVTQTLSTWGGNFYVSKGLGFLYNDHFRGGRGGTGYGSMLPAHAVVVYERADAGVCAVAQARHVTPRLAVGAAGNAWIPASVYEIILNVVDGGMGAQRAIEAPRFLIGNAPGGGSRVQIEDRIPRAVLGDLEARGHTFAKVGRKGEVKNGTRRWRWSTRPRAPWKAARSRADHTGWRNEPSAVSRWHRSAAQVEPHAEHRAARVDEDVRLAEIPAHDVVRRQALLGCVVQQVEDVDEQLDSRRAADRDGPRNAQIHQRLRRQPP